jgi:hypothetical protein
MIYTSIVLNLYILILGYFSLMYCFGVGFYAVCVICILNLILSCKKSRFINALRRFLMYHSFYTLEEFFSSNSNIIL